MNAIARSDSRAQEVQIAVMGFWLSGLALGVTAVSYVLYSPFPIEALVWVVGAVLVCVTLLTIEWPRVFLRLPGEVPEGGLQGFILLSIPAAYTMAPALCGAGLKSCTALGVLLSVILMGLAWVTCIRLYQGESVGLLLAPMIVLSLVPHCACPTPSNAILQRIVGGYAPNSFVLPLIITLFAVAGLRGVRARWGARLVGFLLTVIFLVLVGSVLFGFPWEAHG